MQILNKIPYILIYSRIFLGLIIATIALANGGSAAVWIVILMTAGLLADVFDGIIARSLNVATEKLRVLDSNVDQFFWIVTIASIFYLFPDFLRDNFLWIAVVLALEGLGYIISYARFKKPVATHSILAKIWSVSLLAFLIDLCLNGASGVFFWICIGLGVISRIEIIWILLALKKWTNDVPSIFAVRKINKGEPLQKNRLFNG